MRLLWVLAAALLLAPAAQAKATDVTVYAEEDGCGPHPYCYRFEPALESLHEGQEVRFTLVNDGAAPHELRIASLADADPQKWNTPADAAIGHIRAVFPGETGSGTFIVPEGGIYIWCGIPAHEAAGMSAQAIPAEAPTKDSPAPVAFVLVALLLTMLARRLW